MDHFRRNFNLALLASWPVSSSSRGCVLAAGLDLYGKDLDLVGSLSAGGLSIKRSYISFQPQNCCRWNNKMDSPSPITQGQPTWKPQYRAFSVYICRIIPPERSLQTVCDPTPEPPSQQASKLSGARSLVSTHPLGSHPRHCNWLI